MYATHSYEVALEFGREPSPRDHSAFADNVQIGPAGVVRRVRDDNTVVVAPQVAGTLPDGVVAARGARPAHPRAPPPRRSSYRSRRPCRSRSRPTAAVRARTSSRGRAGVLRHATALAAIASGSSSTSPPASVTRNDGYDWDAADLTPIRVEARAVAGAKHPSPAVEPAVLEFATPRDSPGGPSGGLWRSCEGGAARSWRSGWCWFRCGVSLSFSQGARSLGSFAATGRCYSTSSFGAPSTNCDFKGRHSWLWAPCREAVLIRRVFTGCRN